MAVTWGQRRTLAGICLPVLLLTAPNSRADGCGPRVYAYEDRVVFYSCSKLGTPELAVILLDNAAPLRVTGRVRMAAAREFDAASHYKNYLFLLTWDHLDVYDLADPAHPSLALRLQMRKQRSSPGFERIEKTAENKLQVLSSLGAAEVTVDGDTGHWTMKEIPVTQEMKRKMAERPPDSRFFVESDEPVPVRETAEFRYELIWKSKAKTGEYIHRQYLRKIDKSTERAVSELLLGERLETID